MPLKGCFLFVLSFIIAINAIAQERVLIDFGSINEELGSPNFTNNISTSYQSGYSNGVLLFNQQGISTGINLQVHQAWLDINTDGTTAPDYLLGMTRQASNDSFVGATGLWNGKTAPSASFKLRQLDTHKYYSFSFFGSIMNVTDDREAIYTVTGSTSQSITLNASNNNTQKVFIYNSKPDKNGTITITTTAGPNNTSDLGFYYLNAMELQVSESPMTQFRTATYLELSYPLKQATWETGKTITLLWNSEGIEKVDIAYAVDGSNLFKKIASVAATDSRYDFTIPNVITDNAIIRISSGSLIQQSAPISIIPDDGTVYRIVVLGSSTAAGNGPSHLYNAWVWKYSRYLKQLDTRYEVVNLSQGGFVTYNILPTGTEIPVKVKKTIATHKNITKAIALKASGIIINLPSNDAASNYAVTDQMQNYNHMAQTALQHDIPLWVTTPQPRNFTNNNKQAVIQTEMVKETYSTFNNQVIDFWTGIGNASGNNILLAYDSGDGIHATNEAHQLFYEQVVLKDIHSQVKAKIDTAVQHQLKEAISIQMFPNPAGDFLFIESNYPINKILIYNDLKELVLVEQDPLQLLHINRLKPGFYSIEFKLDTITKTYQLRKK